MLKGQRSFPTLWSCGSVLLALGAMPSAGRAQAVFSVDRTQFTLSGYLRFRGNGQFDFDLDEATGADRSATFYDFRSHVSLGVRRAPFGGLISLDLAGDEFNDGVVLGNENPATVRDLDIRVRHLWVEYDGIFGVRGGRMPGQAGHGIVSHVIRDAIRVWKGVGPATFNFVVIKGGESLAAPTGGATPRATNPAGGEDDDLDAYYFFTVLRTGPGSNMRFEVVGQNGSSSTDRFPEKFYVDVNASGTVGPLRYAAEVALMRGTTPDVGAGRLDNRAYLVYLDGALDAGMFTPALRFGLGSGDADPTDDRQGNFQNLFMDETGLRYTFIFADDIHGYDGSVASLGNGSGFANVTFVQPRLDVRPIPSVSITGSVAMLRATRARIEGTGPLGNRPATGAATTRSIGTEIDFSVRYVPERHVTLFGLFGWFAPGSVYGAGASDALKAEVGLAFSF